MTDSPTPPPRLYPELVRAALIVVAVLIVLVGLWEARVLVLLTVLGLLLGIAAKPAVDWLEKRRIKRGFGAPIVVLGTVGFVFAVGVWSGPTVVMQFKALQQQVPAAIDKLDAYLLREHAGLHEAILPTDSTAAQDSVVTTASSRLGKVVMGQVYSARGMIFGAVTSTLTMIGGLIYILVLTIYISIEPYVYRKGVLLLIPPHARVRGALLVDIITATLRRWLGTQLLAMLVIGSVTTVVLLIIGVKSAIPLGILAGILEFVPNLGPVMSAIPALLIAFADSPQKALIVGIAYWGIQFLENHILIPFLMREEFDLPPALTLLWQALMALLFGVLGLFVAVPLLAAAVVTVKYLYVRGDVPPVRKLRGSREVTDASGTATPA